MVAGRVHGIVHALAQGRLDLVLGDRLAVQVLLENLVVGLADLLDQLLAEVLRVVGPDGRNVADEVVGAHRFVLIGHRLHPDEVHHARELVLGADGQMDRHRVAPQLGRDLLERALEVGADAVHLVDEADARHAILVGLAPHRLRLRLDAGHRVEHGDGAVEHAQRPLDFRREVDVAGRVDDVDAVLPPEAGRRSRRNRDSALLFLLHPVHDGRAFVHFADLVRDPGIEQDAFGRRRLAGIDVGHDADVARAIERCFSWHCFNSFQ
jgi:hypothetical protein